MIQMKSGIEKKEAGSCSVALKKESDNWEHDALARFRRGEMEAFEEFVLHYQDRLFNVIYQMSCDESETRDVLQETFLKAFQSLGGFHGESKVGTWLHRIAVNTFIQRRRKTLPESMDNLMLEQVQFSSREAMDLRPPKPEEVLEEKEGRTLLQNSIARLPEKYRTVLVLRDLEDRSVKETAVILGISVPAVKARLHRARLFVQRELQKVVSYETGGRTPRKSREMKKGETSGWMRRPVRQLASLTAVALLMVGFAGFPTTPRAD